MFALTFSVLACLNARAATTNPSTQPASNFEVHEWSVFVIDGSAGQLNPDGIVSATLPAFVTDHRYGSPTAEASTPVVANPRRVFFNGIPQNADAAAPAPVVTGANLDLPSPVGVIRLVGLSDSKIDVSISTKNGNFVGSWPKAQDRNHQLLWRDMILSDQPTLPVAVTGPDNWFTTLRQVNSAYLSLENAGCERFLTYDVQMPYASPLKVAAGRDYSVELNNTSASPLHDLTLYQGDTGGGCRTVTVGDLPPATPRQKVPTTAVATTAPIVTAPAPKNQYQLAAGPTTRPSDLADAWKTRVALAGVDAADANLISQLIRQYALSSNRLSAVYRMDDAEFDRLLPIEVIPQPAKIMRFGLVIVVNADPSKGTVVDDWIAQLGNNDWNKRDAAYRALRALGPAAAEKLKDAKKSDDLEVVWRAERLLSMLPKSSPDPAEKE